MFLLCDKTVHPLIRQLDGRYLSRTANMLPLGRPIQGWQGMAALHRGQPCMALQSSRRKDELHSLVTGDEPELIVEAPRFCTGFVGSELHQSAIHSRSGVSSSRSAVTPSTRSRE